MSKRHHWFAVVSLLLLSNGPLLVLLSDGYSQGQGAPPTSYPLLQGSFLAIYFLTALSLYPRRTRVAELMRRERYLLALLGLASLSILWSTAPFLTARRVIALFGTVLFGLYLAQFSRKSQRRVLKTVFALALGLSFVFIVLLPKYGVMAGPFHEGIWRGIFPHKNTLGLMMGLSSLVFLLVDSDSEKASLSHSCGFFLSITLLIFSTSKSALAVTGTLLILVCFYEFWCKSYRRLFLPATGASLVATFLVLQIHSDVLAPLVVREWLSPRAVVASKKINSRRRMESFAHASGRKYLWKSVLRMVEKRPLLGYGYQSFWQGMDGPSEEIWKTETWNPPDAHCGYLDLSLDLGLLGLAAFIALLFSALSRLRFPQKETFSWPLFYTLYFLLANLAESNLIRHNNIFFALFIATLFTLSSEEQEPQASPFKASQAS